MAGSCLLGVASCQTPKQDPDPPPAPADDPQPTPPATDDPPTPPPADDPPTPQRPEWWPEPAPEGGLPWVPPRPAGLEPGSPWPPESATTLDWWIRHYGENPDPSNDPRLGANGDAGNSRFARNFRAMPEAPSQAPGCGWGRMTRVEQRPVESCDPFPEEMVRSVCGGALNARDADTECGRYCMRNKDVCRRGTLLRPPLHVRWGCGESVLPFLEGGDGESSFSATCSAAFLCVCQED